MKKQTMLLVGLALVVLLAIMFTWTRREGFETLRCPDGSNPNPNSGKCLDAAVTEPTTCLGGYKFQADSKRCYRASDGMLMAPKCSPGLFMEGAGKCKKQIDPVCRGTIVSLPNSATAPPSLICVPTGTSMFDADMTNVDPSRPLNPDAICKKPGHIIGMVMGGMPKCIASGVTSAAPVTPAPPLNPDLVGGPRPPAGVTTGNTTGGASDTSLGPTNNPGPRNNQIYGPVFTSKGNPGKPGGDSSKMNVYPELLGGIIKPSTRVEGAGIVKPSKNSDTSLLPSAGGLGATEDSKYFPTSRTPGDMDLIPDPFRVSQTFSASNYSFKTDPVPFLTDFSAFQK